MSSAPATLLPQTPFSAGQRAELLSRSRELRAGREKPNRYWKIDLDALDFGDTGAAPGAAPAIENGAQPGVTIAGLADARPEHAAILQRYFFDGGALAGSKFAVLAAALSNTGTVVHVAAGVQVAEPIDIAYDAQTPLFPLTLVVVEAGAHVTVIERISGTAPAIAGITAIVAGEGARVMHAAVQTAGPQSRVFFSRIAEPAKDASVSLCNAEFGASLSVSGIDVRVDAPGTETEIGTLFFPRDDQHVDVVSSVHHNAGESQSQTLVKSAASGRGQARYLGNIRIAEHAQGTEASLRDDALLLSKKSHIDSIPALEIAANDVKAFHGATVGAIDEEQIFYMTSRGVSRDQAERMIALGFFEPVVERFPTQQLREELRAALEAKAGE